jgi:hippurate hydrolase
MLGIAKNMVTLKKDWKGTLIMVGQPAEEIGDGADAMASEMYKKGVPVPNYLLGMHTAPVAVGLYLNMGGDRMAGADQLDVTFKGVGGHGSAPQEAKDPIVMAANAILQYQTVISRNIDPQRATVLTVGAISAGIDNNVIPGSAILKLNLRWFSEKDRTSLLDGIKRINEGIAVSNGLPKELYPTINMKQYVTPLKNNKELVDRVNPILEKIAGPGKNLQFPPVMGSEDFHHLVKDHPNVAYDYILVGIANQEVFQKANKEGKFFPFFNHNGDFEVDLSAIPFGVSLGTAAIVEAFKK